jgi:hypothetical protein
MVSDTPAPALVTEDAHEALSETLEVLRDDADASRALLGLSAVLAEVRSVSETFELVVRMVPEMLEGARCFAATWDRTRDCFTIHARWGYPPELSQLVDDLAAGGGFPVLRSALLGEKAPILVEDAASFPVLKHQDLRRRQLGAYIGIPLARMGEELGVLAVE